MKRLYIWNPENTDYRDMAWEDGKTDFPDNYIPFVTYKEAQEIIDLYSSKLDACEQECSRLQEELVKAQNENN